MTSRRQTRTTSRSSDDTLGSLPKRTARPDLRKNYGGRSPTIRNRCAEKYRSGQKSRVGLRNAIHRPMLSPCAWRIAPILLFSFLALTSSTSSQVAPAVQSGYEFNDEHVHLTNYIQEGTDIHEFLKIMGTRVGRSVLFGIPLQQQWSYRVSGDDAPTYYLNTDAPLYYYSFTDAFIAMAYKSLPPEQQARFDPMITGFDPADMYAADHIRRVLRTFPGVFSGIGEFTIHKEFVSSKVAGGVPSLLDPALDRVLSLAGEVGLVVIIHNDVDVPFPKPDAKPAYLAQSRLCSNAIPEQRSYGPIWA